MPSSNICGPPRSTRYLKTVHLQQPQHSTLRIGLELTVISFAVLVQELALIRWLPGQVRVLAYFPNLILISAFLGLGIGCLRAGKGSLLWLWPASMVTLVGTAWALSGVVFTSETVTDFLWLLYDDLEGTGAPIVEGVKLPIAWAFVASALTFIPLGQLVAERLVRFREQSNSLWGYSFDIAGSLLGVILFSLASFLRTFPVVWFTVIVLALAPFLFAQHRRWAYHAIGALALVAVLKFAEKAEFYSPYYAVSTEVPADRPGLLIKTNGAWHQGALPLSKNDTHPDPRIEAWMKLIREDYHLPYRLLSTVPKKGLVIGAGSGNDVATMLDEGVAEVTAVEIDPLIQELGRRGHPNRPYSDPRVIAVNDDGRAFLNRTTERYDIILFGTLDSLTRLSALSNVRLDNFVYTRECFELARDRLAPGGGFVVLFDCHVADYIRDRQIALLTEIFGKPPLVKAKTYDGHAMFFCGDAFDAFQVKGVRRPDPESVAKIRESTELPDDDWPFLYLVERGVSDFYAMLITVFAGISLVGVLIASPDMRRGLRGRGGIDIEMFLFGVAFLLLETRSVTAMNLAWGATWFTSAVVFAAILTMVLIATIAMAWRPIPWLASVLGLVLSLVAVILMPSDILLDLEPPARMLASIALVGTPVFFASTCFALRFAERARPELAFGWNLLGAVAGGLAEFLSMALGLKALLYIVLAAYLAVTLMSFRSRRAAVAPSGGAATGSAAGEA